MFSTVPKAYAYSNPSGVGLTTVSNFAGLAKTSVTSPTGPTVLNNGDLGIASPGTCTDFPAPCSAPNVNGTIVNGALQFQNSAATTGQTDATAAVTDANGRASNQTITGGLLGGLTLNQGVYDVPATGTNLTGDLTLSGDANSVFIFRASSTLITASGSRVVLTGGAQACNVFWTVGSSATFNGTTQMIGTVIASASISYVGGGATHTGRAIAQTAAITFNNTTVNNSSCAAGTGSSSSSSSSSSTKVCPTAISARPIIIESRRISPTSIFISWGPFQGINTFILKYGFSNGSFPFSTKVTGFSTTINSLPANQPLFVQVAATDNCTVGSYSAGIGLPNTGLHQNSKQTVTSNIFSTLRQWFNSISL